MERLEKFTHVRLTPAIARINTASIPYELEGPKSSSALHYILSQLPTTVLPWYTVPLGLIGWGTQLQGLPW